MNKKFLKRISSFLMVGIGMIFLLSFANHHVTSVQAENVKSVAVNPNQNQTVNLGLKGRNQGQLTEFINQTVTPGNAQYRKYLTPTEFGQKYGATDQQMQLITNYMKKYNLSVYTYPGNSFMNVSGTTKNIEKAFEVKLTQQKYKTEIDQNSTKVHLPTQIAKLITYKYGLFNTYYTTHYHDSDTTSNNEQGNNPNDATKDPNVSDQSYQKFNRNYDNSDLYENGNDGQGQKIGIITSARMITSDLQGFIDKYQIPFNMNQFHQLYGSDHQSIDDYGNETSLDVEQSVALAPKAQINLYVSPNWVESFANAIARDNVDVLTNSYGTSEADSEKSEVTVVNQLLRQAAAQGISTFSSSGDSGPYNFEMNDHKFGVQFSTQFPASSPYITAVGGTTLPFSQQKYSSFADPKMEINKNVTLDHEQSWSGNLFAQLYGADAANAKYDQFYSDYVGKLVKNKHFTVDQFKEQIRRQKLYYALGSGGGFSKFFAIPDYQQSVSGTGTYNARQVLDLKTGNFNNNPKIISGMHSGRNVPDISGNADPYTGYQIMYHGKWTYNKGGTSIVTPQFASMAILINSLNGQRMGFWNPQIYHFANTSNSPFTPLNSLDNDNLYYTGQPGKLYNQATGLGTVDFNKLNKAFADAK